MIRLKIYFKYLILGLVALLAGVLIGYNYHLERSNRQLEQLIFTSRDLFGQQRFLISNYHDSFVTLYDCTFESQVCDLKAGAEKLQLLEKERNQIIEKMNGLSGEVEGIIERNGWKPD
ncbi:MAG: hypothetical protein G01um10147_1080 [Microgenomates group bacterium Gr01-1014_7]|nr:MAG: hypothetical protein G01um10147_1080 [Microgenomates group bacterium Gr01-1014_7]